MIDLDDTTLPLLRDTLDAVAHALGVTDMTEEQEEQALGALLSASRILQRDTLAAVVTDGISMGFQRQTGAGPAESQPAPTGEGPMSADEDGNVSFVR